MIIEKSFARGSNMLSFGYLKKRGCKFSGVLLDKVVYLNNYENSYDCKDCKET